MAKKSNKTSHVMSLITRRTGASDYESDTTESLSADSAEEKTVLSGSFDAEESNASKKTTLSQAMSDNDPASVQLHNALMNQLVYNQDTPPEEPSQKETPAAASAAGSANIAADVPLSRHPNGIQIENIAEEVVLKKAPEIMRQFSMCTCDTCAIDVIALTLNHLTPQYVVSMRGKIYARIHAGRPQTQQEIESALAEACKKVSKNPRHEAKK